MATNILITGVPGIGKTTLVKKLAKSLKKYHPIGFYTEEIRKGGIRQGFGLASLDGKSSILSHVDFQSRTRIGKYRVDVTGFETFLGSIDFFSTDCGLIIVDEIGKMECYSIKFKNLIVDLLDSDKIIIATVSKKGTEFIEKLKSRNDVQIFTLTLENRELLVNQIANLAFSSQI
jgi:nucleoside-triphosphatase